MEAEGNNAAGKRDVGTKKAINVRVVDRKIANHLPKYVRVLDAPSTRQPEPKYVRVVGDRSPQPDNS